MTEREELEMWKKMYMRLLRGTEDAIDILDRKSTRLNSSHWS